MSSVLSWRKRVNRIYHKFNVLVYQTTCRLALLKQRLKTELLLLHRQCPEEDWPNGQFSHHPSVWRSIFLVSYWLCLSRDPSGHALIAWLRCHRGSLYVIFLRIIVFRNRRWFRLWFIS